MRLTDLLNAKAIPFRVSAFAPSEIKLCCPFCTERGQTPDMRFRLGVNISNGKAHCFNCNWASNGHGVSAVMRKLQLFGELDNSSEESGLPAETVRLPSDFQILDSVHDYFDRLAMAYINTRGITNAQVLRKRIGVSYVGRYAYRIVFPVYVQAKLSGIVARDFMGREPRYLNTPGMKSVYNLPNYPVTELILSEGPIKALRIEQAAGNSVTASAALLGHALTDEQLDQIKSCKCSRITIFPDPNSVGQTGAAKIAETIDSQLGIRPYVVLRTTKEADEMMLPEIQSALSSKVPFSYTVRQRMMAVSPFS